MADPDSVNPYAAPSAAGSDERPTWQYSHGQVVCATFFGTLMLAAVMMAKNWRAAGQPERARKALTIGLPLAALLVLASVFIPWRVGSFAVGIACTLWASQYFTKHLAKPYREATRDGVRRHSNWRVFGLIVLVSVLIVTVAFVVGVVLALTGADPRGLSHR